MLYIKEFIPLTHLGKLLYIQKCVKSARILINSSTLALLRKKSCKKRIYLDQESKKTSIVFLNFYQFSTE